MDNNLYDKDQITEMELNKNFSNFDNDWYKKNVINKLLNAKNGGKIELDGHYNEESNEIIASEIVNLINSFENL